MSCIFMTGFPGFLGTELVRKVLAAEPGSEAVCLVQKRFADLARHRIEEIEAAQADLVDRISLVEGDITEPGLGLPRGDGLRRRITEVFHLAAIYDLMVRRRVGMSVNVDGTRNVLDFCEDCPRLRRLQYVSTCYVSGRWAGIWTENDLDKGQSFNNHYEETKYLAEVEVRQRREDGLPVTVYRPAIVVGDSVTGETQKYDGPYYVIRWVLRQPLVALVPMVGDPTAVRVNLVPRDFVVEAISHLSRLDETRDRVFQLSDPAPLTVDELLAEIGKVTGRRVLRVPVMKGPAKLAIDWLPGVHKLLQIPSASVDYFVHPTHYTCDNTRQALEGSGIAVPRFSEYLPNLIRFVRDNPEVGSEAMS